MLLYTTHPLHIRHLSFRCKSPITAYTMISCIQHPQKHVHWLTTSWPLTIIHSFCPSRYYIWLASVERNAKIALFVRHVSWNEPIERAFPIWNIIAFQMGNDLIRFSCATCLRTKVSWAFWRLCHENSVIITVWSMTKHAGDFQLSFLLFDVLVCLVCMRYGTSVVCDLIHGHSQGVKCNSPFDACYVHGRWKTACCSAARRRIVGGWNNGDASLWCSCWVECCIFAICARSYGTNILFCL